MKALEPYYAARTQARAQLDRAADALARAKCVVATAAEHLQKMEQYTSQAAEAAIEQFVARMIADGSSEVQVHSDSQSFIALNNARHDHAYKAKALARLEAARGQAQADLAAAERAVVQAVDQLLGDEIAERARHIDGLLNEAHRLAIALKHFAAAAGLHGTTAIPPATLSLLDRLNLPLINALEIPINLAQLGDVAAFRDWTARREQMIAGMPSEKATAA